MISGVDLTRESRGVSWQIYCDAAVGNNISVMSPWYKSPVTFSCIFRLSSVFVAVLTALSPAAAGSIVVTFGGTIDSSSVAGIGIGDQFTGQMVYKTSGVLFGGGPTGTNYGFFQPQDGVSVTVDGFDFVGSSYLNMYVANGPNNGAGLGGPDADFLQGASDGLFGTLSTTYPGATLILVAVDFIGDPNFLSSADIPIPFNSGNIIVPGTPANPTAIFMRFGDGGAISGYINIVDTEVPEPSTLLLTGAFLALLCHKVRLSITSTPMLNQERIRSKGTR